MMPPLFAEIDDWIVRRIAEFYVYILPPILVALVLRALLAGRASEPESLAERARTIRRIGLIHFGLATWGVLAVVPEFAAYRESGILSNFLANLFVRLGLAAPNVAIGLGERRLSPWARRADVALNGLLTLIVVGVVAWSVRFHRAIDPAYWPEHVLSAAWPPLVVAIMSSGRTRRAFSAEGRAALAAGTVGRGRPSAASLAATVFLVLVWTVVAVSAVDWLIRFGLEPAGWIGSG